MSDMSSDVSAVLREPWHELSRQDYAASFGIWCFLVSEVLFFAGLFLAYTIYSIHNRSAFLEAARETDIWFGTVNTAVLLTSSLTIAVAAQASEARLQRLSAWCLGATAALGAAFLVFKSFEYAEDIRKGLVPGPHFSLQAPAAQIFFALYWVMTGIHAIHLSAGIGLVGRLAVQGGRGRLVLRGNPQVQVTAIYWHFVDVIWVLLYPLIYLPGRAS
jgi:cytochrome c oxidase subunit III